MDDVKIVELYFLRTETAIKETSKKYGGYLKKIAKNILGDKRDVEECLSDVYLKMWNSIPPEKPTCLKAYIAKVVRNLAINKFNFNSAKKRGRLNEISEEYLESIPSNFSVADSVEIKVLLNNFLESLAKKPRIIFVQRYWYFCSIKEIAKNQGESASNIKTILSRTRSQLKDYLDCEQNGKLNCYSL